MGFMRDQVARFERKYVPEPNTGCWIWLNGLSASGYGVHSYAARRILAHRYAYEQKHGPVPDGLDLDHLCRNRWCVNPDHVEPVTRRENLLRGQTIPAVNAAKTHCPRGHEYSERNTHVSVRGQRQCRACGRDLARARRARRWR